MPHLLRLSMKVRPPEGAPYPFSVPQVRTLPELDVNTGVTFFVGENGSGKSTLLEGIAAASELHARGSVDLAVDDTLAPTRQLGAALRLAWSPRSRQGFFLRAEDFFGYNKAQARTDAWELRERTEGRVQPGGLVSSESGIHPDEREVARFIAEYDSRSHGESFMDLFAKARGRRADQAPTSAWRSGLLARVLRVLRGFPAPARRRAHLLRPARHRRFRPPR